MVSHEQGRHRLNNSPPPQGKRRRGLIATIFMTMMLVLAMPAQSAFAAAPHLGGDEGRALIAYAVDGYRSLCIDWGKGSDPTSVRTTTVTAPQTAYLMKKYNLGTNSGSLPDATTIAAIAWITHTSTELPHDNIDGATQGNSPRFIPALNTLTAAQQAKIAALKTEAANLAGPYTLTGVVAGSGTYTATYTLKSAAGKVVPGYTVTFSGTGSATALSKTSAVTNVSGQVALTYKLAPGATGGVHATATGLAGTTVTIAWPSDTTKRQRMAQYRQGAVTVAANVSATAPQPTGKVSVLKHAAGTNAALAGAVFDVRTGSATGTVVGSLTTGANGIGTSGTLTGGVVVGSTVWLTERTAPAGYTKVAAVTAKVTADGTGTARVTLTDPRVIGSRVAVKKTDSSTGAVLAGVTFTAQVQKAGTTTWTTVTGGGTAGTTSPSAGRYVTAATGLVTLNGAATTPQLVYGDQVRFTEVATAAGHLLPANPTVAGTIGTAGTLDLAMTNQPLVKINIAKFKLGSAPHQYLPDAHFELSRIVAGSKQVLAADLVTDANGRISWTATGSEDPAIRVGDTLTLTETESPAGYGVTAPISARVSNLAAASWEGQSLPAQAGIRFGVADAPLDRDIGTSTSAGDTGKNVVPGTNATDTVSYQFLEGGTAYVLKADVRLRNSDGTTTATGITGQATFTTPASTREDGTVDGHTTVTLPIPADLTTHLGETWVVFEALYEENGTTPVVDLTDGKPVTHQDADDTDQFLFAPKIGTTASGEHGKTVVDGDTLTDTIAYQGLEPGQQYEVSGRMVFADSGEDTGLTGSALFRPRESTGTTTVTFTVPAGFVASHAGSDIVAFEVVTTATTHAVVGKHEDLTDKGQTLAVPGIGTTAANSDEKYGQVGTAGTWTDTIAYHGLEVGKEYVASGEFMVTVADGDPLPSGIVGSAKFTPTSTDGQVVVSFPVPADLLAKFAGQSLVAFETVKFGDVTIAVHADVHDTKQTIYVPKIGTTATNSNPDLGQIATPDGKLTDTVSYSGLVPGVEHTVSGEFQVVVDGKPVPTGIKASTTFTPATSNGQVVVTFQTPADLLAKFAGQPLVAFETVKFGDVTIAVHADIKDKAQTVVVPKLGTTAANGDSTLGKTVTAGSLTDTISYQDLVVGKQYTATGEFQVVTNGKPVPTGIKGSATFTPTAPNGQVVVKFAVSAAQIAKYGGQDLVAFETVTQGSVVIGIHADVNDTAQTVHVPKIGTGLYGPDGRANGPSAVVTVPAAGVTLTDRIGYQNLTPGVAYVATGQLTFADGSATGITGTAAFTPTQANGTVEVLFKVPAGLVAGGKTLVVAFETVTLKAQPAKPVATHQDLHATEQQLTLLFGEVTGGAVVIQTGLGAAGGWNWLLVGSGTALLALLLAVCVQLAVRRRRVSTRG